LHGAWILGFAVVGLAGCTKASDPASVSGTVTYKGKPVTSGVVVLIGADGRASDPGPVKQDGSYEIAKAPAGIVKVAFDNPAPAAPAPVPAGAPNNPAAEAEAKEAAAEAKKIRGDSSEVQGSGEVRTDVRPEKGQEPELRHQVGVAAGPSPAYQHAEDSRRAAAVT